MNRTLLNATRELEQEMHRQTEIIYSAAAIVLWAEYGWRKKKILRRFYTSQKVWAECAVHGTKKSMMGMLEDETGIEIRLSGYDKSFHDLAYLDPEKWNGKPPTPAEAVFIRKQQKKWIAPQLTACISIALARDDGFGQTRLGDFIGYVDKLRVEHEYDMTSLLKDVTGMGIEEIKKGEVV